MGSYTELHIDSIRFSWKYFIPPFIALLFEHEDFFYEDLPIDDLEDDGEYKQEPKAVGYRSTVPICKERMNHHGYSLSFIADIYSLFRDELEGAWNERIASWLPVSEDEVIIGGKRQFATARIEVAEPSTTIQELETYIEWLKGFIKSTFYKNFVSGVYADRDNYYEWLYDYIYDNVLDLHPSVSKVGYLFSAEYLADCPEIIELIHCRLLLEAMDDTAPVVLDTADILGSYMRSMDRGSCEVELRQLLLRLPIDLLTKADRYDRFVRMLRDKEASWRGKFSKLQVRTRLREVRTARSRDEKGKALEALMELLFHMPPELVVVDKRYNTGDEEVDIVVKNNMPGTFWSALASPLLFVECKNWKEKAGALEARDFAGKLRHHSGLVKLGFFVSTNGFTSQFDETLKREAATGCSIIKITVRDIESYAEGMAEMSEWLGTLITKLV